ncbi:MAG: UDP-N-acetylmuramoyl-L-alanine--D-glutamate ligase [Pseudomonadota bacterium]
MIPVTTAKDRTIAVFGLGGSGLVTAQALNEGGANVVAWDDNPDRVAEAESQGISCRDLRTLDFSTTDALVLAPGVPLTHPQPHWTVQLANDAGVPIIGDVELFGRELAASNKDARYVAITGTNGKSTTTALIAHVLKEAGRDVQMGGNIGTAVLALKPPQDDRVYVVECSSYQIDLAPGIAPDVGILLNLSPDHLDRHGAMEDYASIKERLVAASSNAIVGVDDKYCRDIADRLEAGGVSVARISGETQVERNYSLEGIGSLRGRHNAQNAAAAYEACRLLGLSADEIQAGFSSFGGLVHRMEQVGHVGKVLFANDSKATNAEATAPALASYHDIYWIAGGLAKDGGIEELRPLFGPIRKAYLIGEAAAAFSATLGGVVDYEISETLDAAVHHAARDAASSDAEEPVILLSPACASFDQFPNFSNRGNAFKDLVRALPGFSPSPSRAMET